MQKITITTTSFGKFSKETLALLDKDEYEVVLNPYGRKLNRDEIVELCRNATGIIAGNENLDGWVLEQLNGLKVISRCRTGMDNVDLKGAQRLGIKVFNTPDGPTLAVAELTLGLILNLLRKISQMDRSIRAGKWDKLMGNALYGKKVGIIGFGRIGRKVAVLLKAFGCEVFYADPCVDEGTLGFKRMALTDLLKTADIVTLHVSGKEKIIGEKELSLMKKGAKLINVSRGEIIDEEALLKKLSDYSLSGAALDVFEKEPYDGPLCRLENVILTPHIGSYALESRIEMENQSVRNLLEGLNNG